MRKIIAIVFAASLALASVGTAFAGNPHCAGNSDNVNLPSGHVNNFPSCG